MDQHQITILVVTIGAIVFAAAFGFFVTRKRRSRQLRERFLMSTHSPGPESGHPCILPLPRSNC